MYNVILTWGKDEGLIINHNLQQYICDFEKAQRNGFESIFSKELDIALSGEEFHFKQAILKNIKEKHLSGFYVNKKNSKTYDVYFRKHSELMYNLMHIKPGLIKEFAKLIMQSLWIHAKHKYDRVNRKYFLSFIIYYLVGWCEFEKKDLRAILKLRGSHVRYLNKRKTQRLYKISEWNIFDKNVKNTNAIEVNNRHDRVQIGYYPTIDKLMKRYLELFDESVRKFISDQKLKYMPGTSQKKHVKQKNRFIEDNANHVNTFSEYIIFSAELTHIKYKHDKEAMKYYFYDETMVEDNTTYFEKTEFNEMVNETLNTQNNELKVQEENEDEDAGDELSSGEEDAVVENWFEETEPDIAMITDNINKEPKRTSKRQCVIRSKQEPN